MVRSKTEIVIEKLQDIGREVNTQGYSFSCLQESFTLYWELMFGSQIEFTKEQIVFSEPQQIGDMVEKRGFGDLYTIYSLLPKRLQQKCTVEDVKEVYAKSVGGWVDMFRRADSIAVGHYNLTEDRCYVSTVYLDQSVSLGNHQITTAGHELTHRYVHLQRMDYLSLREGKWLSLGGLEEQFCVDVERDYGFYLFSSHAFERIHENLAFSRKRLRSQMKEFNSPTKIKKYTDSRVNFYTACLEGMLEKVE